MSKPYTPAWLVDAIAARGREKAARQQVLAVEAEQIAARINDRLAELGMTPIKPASATPSGMLEDAVLVQPGWDEDEGTESWGVRASWNATGRVVCLWAEGGPGSGVGGTRTVGNAGPLESAADVVRAMYEGPLKPVIREWRPVGGQPIDTADVVRALHELAVAVLHLADEASGLR